MIFNCKQPVKMAKVPKRLWEKRCYLSLCFTNPLLILKVEKLMLEYELNVCEVFCIMLDEQQSVLSSAKSGFKIAAIFTEIFAEKWKIIENTVIIMKNTLKWCYLRLRPGPHAHLACKILHKLVGIHCKKFGWKISNIRRDTYNLVVIYKFFLDF